MEISVISYGHPLWDKTISFAENCSWRAGPYLARKMRNNEFEKIERVIVATENNMPVGFCTFILKEDELPEDTKQSPFIGFVFVDEKSRGKRISKKMIDAALDYSKTNGYQIVYLISGEIGLYEKYGFKKIGNVTNINNKSEQLFQKKLAK